MTKNLKPEDAIKPEHDFITVIKNRSPERKSHAKLGQAKGAISWRFDQAGSSPVGTPMEILERQDGVWKTLYLIPATATVQPWGAPALPAYMR